MSAKLDAVKLLLHFGGRFDVKDNDGTTCFDLAAHFPKVNALVSEPGAEKARTEKKSEGAFKCGSGCGRQGSKRCTGCYLVYFCSDACFKETWPTHKSNCKETRAQYKTVKLTTQFVTNLNYRSNQVTTSSKAANTPSTKKHFIVKVQVSQGLGNEPLMVYNEDRSMMGVLKKASAPQVYDTLVVSIEKHGIKGLKGFFYAIYKKDDASSMTLEINPEVVLPLEKW